MKTDSLETAAPLLPVEALRCDAFEQGLLPVLRHFLNAFAAPDRHDWHRAYAIAAERWHEQIGLSVAHHLQKLLRAILRCRIDGLAFQDPLCPHARQSVTEDERLLINMLHYMRRDQTAEARDCVECLTHGRMDPDVIRTGLGFAARFSSGAQVASHHAPQKPTLRVVR